MPSAGGAAVRAACGIKGRDLPASGEGSGLRERVVACLCEAGAPVDYVPDAADGSTALHLAASKGLENTVTLLLAAGADASRPNLAGESAADVAKRGGHEELAGALSRERALGRRPTALPPLNGAKALPDAANGSKPLEPIF